VNALTATFHQLLADNLGSRPGKQALVDADRSVSYAALAAEADRVAGHLRDQGVAPGDRVIVHLRKSIAEAAAMFAVSKVGAVVVNVNVQWTLEQLGYVAEDCGARLMIVEPRTARELASRGLPASVSRILAAGEAPGERGSAAGTPSQGRRRARRSRGSTASSR
jgi:acyl-CoA synthetase (AMP-forming)/AMP-acid ligase II